MQMYKVLFTYKLNLLKTVGKNDKKKENRAWPVRPHFWY